MNTASTTLPHRRPAAGHAAPTPLAAAVPRARAEANPTARASSAGPFFATRPARLHAALLPLAVALMLSACAAGPDYVAPTPALAPAFVHAQAPAAATPVQLESWWNHFDDPVLGRLIARVLAQNLDLAAALARVEQARADASHSRAALLPTVSAGASVATERQSTESPLGALASSRPGYRRGATLYADELGASWELDLAGGLKRGAQADAAEAQAAEADRLGVRVAVAAEAADAYFRVRGAQLRIALAEQALQAERDLLELVELRLKEGLATEREQAQAEARVAQVRATLAPLRAEREIELNRLDVLSGARPGTSAAELAGPARDAATPPLALALTPADLLRRRPDVIAAERRLAASSARIGVAAAAYYPTFSLEALLGFESLRSATPSAASFQPQALLGLRWRLFDFGRIDAEVARADAARSEALARYRQALLRAGEDVENALVTQAELAAEREDLLHEVAASQRARDASEQAYRGGALSLLEVLEQDRQLLAARDRLVQVQTGGYRAVVATFRAVGGGW